ncbi:hypothetical protein FGB62_9g213 [Gracilaria domingensis]|nr:hypothetical protein FGB62_9g213 [Gracilaria domingensis]
MRSLLHSVLYFEVLLRQYADIVKEVDVLYPSRNWEVHEYHDRSTHSPVLLRTIARSSAAHLRTLRLPLYQFEGAETILPVVFEECKQLEVLAFDDGSRVDDHIGKLMGTSTISDLTVNRPSNYTIAALRDGLHHLRTLRLHMLDSRLVNHLHSILKSSCLTQLEYLSLEFSERYGVVADNSGKEDPGDENTNANRNLTEFLDDLGAHLVHWLPLLRNLKLCQTSNHRGRSASQLRRTDVSAVDRMAASIVASRTPRSRNGCSHGVRRMIHLCTASSSQLQRMKTAMQDSCRAADVRLDINGYGVFIPMDVVQQGDESPSDFFVRKVNMGPVIITRVFGANEFPEDEYQEFSMLEEVFIHLNKIMTHYSSHLWAFWCNCGTLVRKASIRCCPERKCKDTTTEPEEDKDADEQRRERVDLMIFHMTVTLKNLKILELTVCALTDTEGNEAVVPKWMRGMFQRECLGEMRHLNFVACNCEGAVGSFVRLCTSILEMFCQLPKIESVHMLRGGRPSMPSIEFEQLDDAAKGVKMLSDRYAEVSLAGVGAALKEWRRDVRCMAAVKR